jgi:hypothetical protein
VSLEVGVWVGALLTLGILSFLYKDNPLYRITESIFIGCSAGYWAVVYFFDSLQRKMWEGIFPVGDAIPDYWLLGGLILGVMILFRLSNKLGYLARTPLAFIVGATSGLMMLSFLVSNGLNQVASTINDLWVTNPETGFILSQTISAWILFVGVLSGLMYFFFSAEHKGAIGRVARLGIFFLMLTFGGAFGFTIMSRVSLLIGRMDYLFGTWLGLLH